MKPWALWFLLCCTFLAMSGLALAEEPAPEPEGSTEEASPAEAPVVDEAATAVNPEANFVVPVIPLRWWGLSTAEVKILHAAQFPEVSTILGDPLDPTILKYKGPLGGLQGYVVYRFENGALDRIVIDWIVNQAEQEAGLGKLYETWQRLDSETPLTPEQLAVMKLEGGRGSIIPFQLGSSLVSVWTASSAAGDDHRLMVYAYSPANQFSPGLSGLSSILSDFPDKTWPLPSNDFESVDPQRYKQLLKLFKDEPSYDHKFAYYRPKQVDFKQLKPSIVRKDGRFYIEVELELQLEEYIEFGRVTFKHSGGVFELEIPPMMRHDIYIHGEPTRYGTGGLVIPGWEGYALEVVEWKIASGTDQPGLDLGDLLLLSRYEEPMVMTFHGKAEDKVFNLKPKALLPLHDTLELFQLMGGELPAPLQPRSKPPKADGPADSDN